VVLPHAFTDDIPAAIKILQSQWADGGGDWPEALDEALMNAVFEHEWLEDSVKVMMVVLDAPAHNRPDAIENLNTAMMGAAARGIRIVPVIASGFGGMGQYDLDLEFMMRNIVAATGGVYTFLTRDSGIGSGHVDPSIGEFEVEMLNDLLVRIIGDYLTIGTLCDDEPEPDEPQEPDEPEVCRPCDNCSGSICTPDCNSDVTHCYCDHICIFCLIPWCITDDCPRTLWTPELARQIIHDCYYPYEDCEQTQDMIFNRELMYLGTYGNSVVIFGLEMLVSDSLWSEEVEGFTFNYNHGYRIWVWDSQTGVLWGLTRSHWMSMTMPVLIPGALEAGLLTADDVGEIHRLFEVQYHGTR
jgi:hypothetical protein